MNPRPFSLLRDLTRKRVRVKSCELCSRSLAPEHQHLLELPTRQLLCCCDACAILFSGQQSARYRRVPRRLETFQDFRLSDPQWEELRLPINLAFFFHHSAAGHVIAIYPSPAGPMESLLPLEGWQELVKENPILQELEPDVEALLVNRVGQAREYYRVPIDACYKLVGLIRTHWRGLSGGTEVWEQIGRFFAELKARSSPNEETSHA